MYKKLIQLIEKNAHQFDEEVHFIAKQLEEIIEAKAKNNDIDYIMDWLKNRRKNYLVTVEEIGVTDLKQWNVDPNNGNISHESGKFYSIIGIKISGAVDREVSSWTQPVIKQDECGILGILTKKISGVRHYLLQAKFEPGNKYLLQLSPTLQATTSNLAQTHKGQKPLFAEYFENFEKFKVLISVESVEDGGRLFLKTNRNMIVEIDENEEINLPDNFIWVNLYQLKKIIKKDMVINSLTRNILGSI